MRREVQDFPDTNSQTPSRAPGRLKASWPDLGEPVVKPAESHTRWVVFCNGVKVSECKSWEDALRMHGLFGGNPKRPERGATCVRRYSVTEEDIQILQAKARAEKRWASGHGA